LFEEIGIYHGSHFSVMDVLGSLHKFRYKWTGAQSALHFGGGEIYFINFIWWRHRAYSTVVQRFRKRSQIKFSSQHFRKWELFSFTQDVDRRIRRE